MEKNEIRCIIGNQSKCLQAIFHTFSPHHHHNHGFKQIYRVPECIFKQITRTVPTRKCTIEWVHSIINQELGRCALDLWAPFKLVGFEVVDWTVRNSLPLRFQDLAKLQARTFSSNDYHLTKETHAVWCQSQDVRPRCEATQYCHSPSNGLRKYRFGTYGLKAGCRYSSVSGKNATFGGDAFGTRGISGT